MAVLMYLALASSDPAPFPARFLQLLTSSAAVFLLGDILSIFLGYFLGWANYSPKRKAALWVAIAACFSFQLYRLLSVGVVSDADIFKPFLTWYLFLMAVLFPIGMLTARKKR